MQQFTINWGESLQEISQLQIPTAKILSPRSNIEDAQELHFAFLMKLMMRIELQDVTVDKQLSCGND